VHGKRRWPGGPWGRLAWTLPVALALTTLALVGFLEVLATDRSPPATSNAVALQIVELPVEPSHATPTTHETTQPKAHQPPPPQPEPAPKIEPPPLTPVRPALPQPTPTPKIEPLPLMPVPSPTPAPKTEPPPAMPLQPTPPQPQPTPTTELPLPPPPPPAIPPRRETTPEQPRRSDVGNAPPLRRDLMRATPQHPTAASTAAAPAARSSTGGMTMGARALYRPMPEIPEELRHRELAVVAMARFRVAADGSATVELLQATADPRLNTALMSALRKWRFFPAMNNGRPIASTIDIRVPIEVR
jgi:periplasmic protein TonB